MDNLKREYSWMGYVRKNGAMGIRNKVLVIYTVECASFVAREIVRLAGTRRQRWSDFRAVRIMNMRCAF